MTLPNNEQSLGLYVHIPWCVQKCPYCDFNSHNLKGGMPESEYVSHVLDDLSADLDLVRRSDGSLREVSTIFIGGGTPSLLSVDAMARLLQGIKQRMPVKIGAEITMEANPGTVEADKFVGFAEAGITRISVGVQSFNQKQLSALGRIHDSQQAVSAIELASSLNIRSFNLDLMHGLPGQSIDDAMEDLEQAIALNPPHLSWYQLTIEPNTSFHSKPPTLPDDDVLWEIQEQGHAMLAKAGYLQYEISAYSKPGHQCQHNLNYWRFGDYLGIGCGAHGKISRPSEVSGLSEVSRLSASAKSSLTIQRTVKVKHPKGFMDLTKPYLDKIIDVEHDDLAFEFFMNRFRIFEVCQKSEFQRCTGTELSELNKQHIEKAVAMGLLNESPDAWQVTDLGKRYLNSLLDLFV
ncbi:radical SAM family heme chaperone HemW [Glaciecola sp. MH2013]|uniref:radical SAM family heme chaperone HemW n=1 Tax=Glaciecola sp. MH2013 TaxID=2785524 RepID=UPI00189C86EA|nr:radical SAM family heme chaperone HemW [Glaciecola sp. MH2013]MBF7074837.1 radical SAM family heme chaperone HemW [Glaciecola sp. MH2013]